MTTKHKAIPLVDPAQFSERLRTKRLAQGLTLKEVEARLGIDAGQISRFERGGFKKMSRNLNKYANFLQIMPVISFENSLENRVLAIAARSNSHRIALEEIVAALERLA